MKLKCPTQPHPNYKDSGVIWLGQIPSHWEVPRTKFVARLESGHTPSRDDSKYWGGDIPWFSLADISQIREKGRKYITETEEYITEAGIENSGARLLPQGTVVLSRTASVGFTCILGKPAATDQSMVNWVCGSSIKSEFLYYVFKAMEQEFERLARGSTHETIYMPDMRKFSTPLPPIEEQTRIISFLNYHIKRIDSLIKKKRRLLDLITEKRKAVLTDLIRFNQAKERVPLKYVVESLPGFAFSSDGFSDDSDDIRLLRGINVKVGAVSWEDVAYWPKDDVEKYKDYLLEPGDIVLGMDRPWISDGIRLAQIEESDCPALLVQRVLRMRAKDRIKQDYIRMLLGHDRFRQYFEPITTGVSVPHISEKQVGEFEIPIPSLEYQSTMISQWETFEEAEVKVRNAVRSSIGLLEERRQSLIMKAVTGQIDLSDWQPPDEQEALA